MDSQEASVGISLKTCGNKNRERWETKFLLHIISHVKKTLTATDGAALSIIFIMNALLSGFIYLGIADSPGTCGINANVYML